MGRERDLHVLMHWDGRAIESRTLNDWWKEALRYAVVDLSWSNWDPLRLSAK